ncbi:rhombosortase [Thioalkalivibrio sulfidiphilus]|uniref:rhombosortase n=1 Tax=Thioalkalivibrio sulfidiphilus TaxID=1033854 RepID=UPI000382D333|nr:rhombosortase [Thioalkalivibrio sulfidiphilus]
MNNPAKPRLARWALPLTLALAALLAQAFGGLEALRLERGLWLEQPWRLVTGQLMHLGWIHLAMNLAGLTLIWFILARNLSPAQWWLTVLICGAGVNLGLLAFSPTVAWYVGLSGILHGLLAAGALAGLKRQPCLGLLLLGLIAKLAWEQSTGQDPGIAQLIGGAVIVEAHLYGALAGVAAGGYLLLRRTHRPV